MAAVLRIDDQLPLVQKFVGHGDGLVEESARVAAQVEDELRHPLRPQRVQRRTELPGGRPCELPQLDIADAVHDAEGRLDAPDRNDAAFDLHLHQSVDPLPAEPQTDLRAARPAQHLHHVVLRNFPPGDERIADLDDPVPGLDAGLVARAVRDDVQHDHRIGGHVEHHADPVELAFERLVQRGHLRRGDIDRMGVQLPHEQRNDVLGERIHRHRIDVAVLDERQRIGQFVGRHGHVAQHPPDLRRRVVPSEILAEQDAQHDARRQDQRENHRMFRISVHRMTRPAAATELLVLEGIGQTH